MNLNDVYYTASLIEFVGRKTNNRRSDIVKALGIEGIQSLLDAAPENHCLSMEQVADELVEDYEIQPGSFDTVHGCKFPIPSETRIGKIYARLIERLAVSEDQYAGKMYEVFTSDLPDAISDFNSALFFAPADEIAFYYETEYKN